MKKSASLLKLRPLLSLFDRGIKPYSGQGNSGYTLIELLVVTIIIGILAAIAAPGWLGFVNQRRVSAANEVVFRALQEAQNMAKSRKLSYSVAFDLKNDVPAIAVYQRDTTPSDADWRSLGKDLAIKKDQILVRTNLQDENQKQGNFDSTLNPSKKKITFDYMGAISPAENDNIPLIIEVSVPQKGTSTPLTSTVRCVKVITLLGAMKTGRGQDECKAS